MRNNPSKNSSQPKPRLTGWKMHIIFGSLAALAGLGLCRYTDKTLDKKHEDKSGKVAEDLRKPFKKRLRMQPERLGLLPPSDSVDIDEAEKMLSKWQSDQEVFLENPINDEDVRVELSECYRILHPPEGLSNFRARVERFTYRGEPKSSEQKWCETMLASLGDRSEALRQEAKEDGGHALDSISIHKLGAELQNSEIEPSEKAMLTSVLDTFSEYRENQGDKNKCMLLRALINSNIKGLKYPNELADDHFINSSLWRVFFEAVNNYWPDLPSEIAPLLTNSEPAC